MKTEIKILCLLLLPLSVFGQISVDTATYRSITFTPITIPSDTTYFNLITMMGRKKALAKEVVIAAKVSSLPKNFADTLRKYDWYALSNYAYHDPWFNNFFSPERPSIQYTFMRISTDSVLNLWLLMKDEKGAHFEKLPDNGKFQGVETRNDTNFLVQKFDVDPWERKMNDYRQYEYRRIVSYKKGVLIIDQLGYSTTPATEPIVFRLVYMKVERPGK